MFTEYKVVPPKEDTPAPVEAHTPADSAIPPAPHLIVTPQPDAAPVTKKSTKLLVAGAIILCFIVGLAIAHSSGSKPTKPAAKASSASSAASDTTGQDGNTQAQTDNNKVVDPTIQSDGQVKDEGNFCSNPINAMTAC